MVETSRRCTGALVAKCANHAPCSARGNGALGPPGGREQKEGRCACARRIGAAQGAIRAIRVVTGLFAVSAVVRGPRHRDRSWEAPMPQEKAPAAGPRGMGGTRLELVTSTMSTWRSNQLS